MNRLKSVVNVGMTMKIWKNKIDFGVDIAMNIGVFNTSLKMEASGSL